VRQLLERDHPVLSVETSAQSTIDLLHSLGYATELLSGSSNVLCRCKTAGRALFRGSSPNSGKPAQDLRGRNRRHRGIRR
jgi:hypothetical protein